jgi:hypothetical protein
MIGIIAYYSHLYKHPAIMMWTPGGEVEIASPLSRLVLRQEASSFGSFTWSEGSIWWPGGARCWGKNMGYPWYIMENLLENQ